MHQFLRRVRRKAYGVRRFIPHLRERHELEKMVGPLGYWEALRAYQLQVLLAHGLKPRHTLLDLGCGPLQGGVGFISYLDEGNYVGVDRDPRRLAAAHEQVARHAIAHKRPRLILSEAFGLQETEGLLFDYVWASQVLYYFHEETMERFFSFLALRLRPEGRMLGDIVGRRHPEYRKPRKSAFLRTIHLHRVEDLKRMAAPFGLKVRPLGEISGFGYPERLMLRTNVLVEITGKKRRPAQPRRSNAS